MNEKKQYKKLCVVCDKPFIAYNGKAMYCSQICKTRGVNNQTTVKRSMGLLWELERSAIMKRLDFLTQAVCMGMGINIPTNLIPKENLVSTKSLGYELATLIHKAEGKTSKSLRTEKNKIERKQVKEPSLKKKNFMTELKADIEATEKVNKIDYPKLTMDIRNLITSTIQQNTGKFPILSPQANSKIEKIIYKVSSKIEGELTNQIIFEYIEDKITDIKTMIDADYF